MEGQATLSVDVKNGRIGTPIHFSENGFLGRTYKVSLVSLKRVGSIISFTPSSRKSSVKSVASKTSSESNDPQIRKNSGQFDGCGYRTRKHSKGRSLSSTSSHKRKVSTNSQRDQIIAEIYRELEQLKELEFSSSSSDEDNEEEREGRDNKSCDREEVIRRKRVESYIREHSHIFENNNFYIGEDPACDDSKDVDINNINIPIVRLDDDNNNITSVKIADDVYIDEFIEMNYNELENIPETPIIDLEDDDKRSFSLTIENENKRSSSMTMEDENKRSSSVTSDTDEGYYSSHAPMSSNRLTRLFLGGSNINNNNINSTIATFHDSFHGIPAEPDNRLAVRTRIKPKHFNYLQVPEEGRPDSFTRNDFIRSSVNSTASFASFNSTLSAPDTTNTTPMNFIPGQTKAIPRQSRSGSLSLNYVAKMKFCFKGIMCQIDKNMPRTFKAMAHAGMLSISIIGPSEHRCAH